MTWVRTWGGIKPQGAGGWAPSVAVRKPRDGVCPSGPETLAACLPSSLEAGGSCSRVRTVGFSARPRPHWGPSMTAHSKPLRLQSEPDCRPLSF